MPFSPWKLIPKDILNTEKLTDQAQSWAAEQRSNLATMWANTQRSAMDALASQFPAQSLPEPQRAPTSGFAGAAGMAGPSGGGGELEQPGFVQGAVETAGQVLLPPEEERQASQQARQQLGLALRRGERGQAAELIGQEVERGVRYGDLPGVGVVKRVGKEAVEAGAQRVVREGFAGNIRLEKLPEGVQDVVRETFEQAPDVMEAARRGVLDDATVRQMAEDVGANAEKFIQRWKPGQAANAETLLAMREALTVKTKGVMAAREAVQQADTTENLLKLRLVMEEQRAVQEAVSGVTAEAGRALRQFRQSVTGAIDTGDVDQMQKLLEKLGGREFTENLAGRLAQLDQNDPVAVYKFIRNATKPRFNDYLTELWYNSVLSGPKTHIVNFVGNAIAAATSPIERVGAAVVEAPLAAAQRRPRERFLGEATADVVGMLTGFPEGIRKGLFVLRNGFSLDEAVRMDIRRTQAFTAATPRLISAGPGAVFGGVTGATQGETPEEHARNALLGAAAGGVATGASPRLTGTALNVPSRALAAADVLWRGILYRGALNAEAYRLAARGKGTVAGTAEQMAELLENPSLELLQRAEKLSKYRVFQQEPGKATQAIMRLRDSFEIFGVTPLRFVIPFIQTPTNLMKFGLERSPLGLLNPKMWQNIARRDPEAADQIARVAMGSAVAASIGALVATGRIDITGEAPVNAAERDRFYREGKQPFSVRIGDTWVNYQKLEPFNQPLAQVAAVVDAVRNGDERTATEVAAQAGFTIGQNLMSQNYMDGMGNLLEAFSDPQRYGERFLTRIATGFVPGSSLLRTVAQAGDPTIRQPRGIAESVQAGIPGLSQNVPPRLTAFGEEIQRETPALSPIQTTRAKDSPVDRELGRLGVEVGFVGKSIRSVPLEREEQHEYQRFSGRIQKRVLEILVRSDAYQRLSDAQKAKAIETLNRRVRDKVAEAYLRQVIQRVGAAEIRRRMTESQKKAS